MSPSKPAHKYQPASKERQAKIRKFLTDSEDAVLKIADEAGLEVYVEQDTRGKFPSVIVRVVMREFKRDGKLTTEIMEEKGISIAKKEDEGEMS